jgi:hypothetical protein
MREQSTLPSYRAIELNGTGCSPVALLPRFLWLLDSDRPLPLSEQEDLYAWKVDRDQRNSR